METSEILSAIQNAADTIAMPNWAAVMSAIAAVGAVVVAVVIAIKQVGIAQKQNEIAQKQAEISEQQNKIALFELRYDVLRKFAFIINVGAELYDNQEIIDVSKLLNLYKVTFDLDILSLQESQRTTYVLSETRKIWFVVQKAPFIFPDITHEEIMDLFDCTVSFLFLLSRNETRKISLEEPCIKNYIEKTKEFKEKHWDKIKSNLDLTGDD